MIGKTEGLSGDSLQNSAIYPGQEYTCVIESLLWSGEGLAHIEGKEISVAGALPGQQVRIVITRMHGERPESKVLQVMRKAKDEGPPRCDHVHDAASASWQCIPYNKQVALKEGMVRDALTYGVPVDEQLRMTLPGRVLRVIPSPHVFYYRNKIELNFGYENMRVEESGGRRKFFDENPNIGFHQPGEWSTIVPVTDCHLYDEQLAVLLNEVRRFVHDTRLPVYNPKTHKGILRTLVLRRGLNTGEQMICFTVNAKKKDLEPLFQHFMRFTGRPGLVSLLLVENTGVNERPDHPKIHCLHGKPSVTERLFDLEFEISPFSFFQTNTFAAEKLYQAIVEQADINLRDIVLDAYCGMGTIGQYLARFCQKVVGIESHPGSIEDALRSSSKNKVANISFYKGRTEQVLAHQLPPGGKYAFDVMVLDPPRAGLHPKALQAVLAHRPRQVVYISCNLATLTRDMGGFLKGGYELRSVQPVDMFPHTVHIETVTVLQRKDS
ncbi:23S rRNA (uracil(1939)-C(5))-methyltransferase RlmD [Candidatus Peregrinibacteria bacterium]|nr:23S rRNA (uracil(1939)-C(5))-methyltransferase RlmD [Candidatus Peregrinibacteria bacterium]